MVKAVYRHLGLMAVKYAPSVLALTCSVKILLNCLSSAEKDAYLLAINWVNSILSLFILGAVYVLGKCYGYCWKHRSLCKMALWGYVYYIFFLTFQIPRDEVLYISILYVAFVIASTLLYTEIK